MAPLKQKVDREDPEFVAFLEAVKQGKTDTKFLRQNLSTMVNYATWDDFLAMSGEALIGCDKCGEACFACKSQSVYREAFQVCDLCFSLYEYCEGCKATVLAADKYSATHIHDFSLTKKGLYFSS